MRNKHNEGYTLPLVMVVLLVLAIVAVTIMTTSLKNMLRQQSFIEQMQAQYEAQGKIEAVVAQVENTPKDKLEEVLKGLSTTEGFTPSADLTSGYTVEITSSHQIGSTQDSVIIYCKFDITPKDVGKHEITYTSYEISKTGGGS